MIKDELYPDYEEHHIEILSELDSDDVIETPESSNGDCRALSIIGVVVICILIFGLLIACA